MAFYVLALLMGLRSHAYLLRDNQGLSAFTFLMASVTVLVGLVFAHV